jgi:hypothetical protein
MNSGSTSPGGLLKIIEKRRVHTNSRGRGREKTRG